MFQLSQSILEAVDSKGTKNNEDFEVLQLCNVAYILLQNFEDCNFFSSAFWRTFVDVQQTGLVNRGLPSLR